MKYFETLIEDQETTISILYKEQIIRIYSSEPSTIHRIIKVLGQPTIKYKKTKTYWSGASWDVSFFDLDKIKEILYRDTFIDKKLKPIENIEKKKTKIKQTSTKKETSKVKETKSKKTNIKNETSKVKETKSKTTSMKKESKKVKGNKPKEASIMEEIKIIKEEPKIKNKKVAQKEIKNVKNKSSAAENKNIEKEKKKRKVATNQFEQMQLIF